MCAVPSASTRSQSAAVPGSTSPRSFGPSTVPPVTGTMRSSPFRPAPTFCGAPVESDMRNRNSLRSGIGAVSAMTIPSFAVSALAPRQAVGLPACQRAAVAFGVRRAFETVTQVEGVREAGGLRRLRRGQAAGAGAADEEELVQRGEARSEEHTSELQSRQYLVCRLL